MKELFNIKKLPFHLLLFSFISVALFNSFLCEKHFSADGVYYFWEILEMKDFVHHDWARQYSLYITQWPVVLAVNFGIKNIPILSLIFAFGIYSIYLLSFLACINALRNREKAMLLWPIASMVALNLSTDYHLSGEYPVIMLMAWPVLFYIIRQNRHWSDEIILWVLLLIFSRIYQSAAVISMIFLAVLLYQYFITKDRHGLLKIAIPVLLCLLIILISLKTIIFPLSQENEINFIEGIYIAIFNKEAVVSAAFMIIFFTSLFFKKDWLLIISILPLLIYLFIMIKTDQGISAFGSFASRSLSITFLPFLILCSLFTHYKKLQVTRTGMVIFFFFTVLMVTGNLRYSANWNDYRKEFTSIIKNETGFVAVEETNLMKNKCYWGWTNPYLSLVWSDGCVKSMVLNESARRQFPYDPSKQLLLKDYVSYNDFFLQVDSSASICR